MPGSPDGGARVLVVDDRDDASAVTAAVLAAAGFAAAPVRTGDAALRALRDESVAVVVVGLVPDGDRDRAATMVGELRGRPEPQVCDAAVVVLVDDAVGAASATGAGADLTVVRPVEPARLVAAVTEVSSVPPEVRRRRRP